MLEMTKNIYIYKNKFMNVQTQLAALFFKRHSIPVNINQQVIFGIN